MGRPIEKNNTNNVDKLVSSSLTLQQFTTTTNYDNIIHHNQKAIVPIKLV